MHLITKAFVVGLALVALFATPALAQDSGTYVTGGVTEREPPSLEVGPADPADPADPGAQVLGTSQERGDDPVLPVTGGDVVGLVALATVLIAAGGVAVAITRSRRVTPA